MTDDLVAFARALRAAGVDVGTGAVADFVRAAELCEDAYWAGRATLVTRQEQIATYDTVFRACFAGERPPRAERPLQLPATLRPGGAASADDVRGRMRDGSLDPLELALDVPLRRARRLRTGRERVDLRRTLRRALRSDGEPLRLERRARRPRPRRVVLLLDVSGSMTEHARPLVVRAHRALRANRRWEVFCFATRLTRLTRALADGDPERALRRAAAEVTDWEGGTRIGESLKRFLDDYGHAGLARGAVVVVCSDGLEVGDPALLAAQLERLQRLAYRVVWLNPLAARPGYEPTAGGMAAALPFVDVFAPLGAGSDPSC